MYLGDIRGEDVIPYMLFRLDPSPNCIKPRFLFSRGDAGSQQWDLQQRRQG